MWQIFFILHFQLLEAQYVDVTSKVFPADLENVFVAAYADIDGDKHTDVFLSTGNDQLIILSGNSQNSLSFSTWQTITYDISGDIKAILPADFNGDGFTDLLLTVSGNKGEDSLFLCVCFGLNTKMLSLNLVHVLSDVKDQPLLLDANGDMISDLFVTLRNNSRRFLLGHQSPIAATWKFHTVDFITKSDTPPYELKVPHSSAFVDTNGDGICELFITSINEGISVYEVWKGSSNGLHLFDLASLKKTNNMEVGQSLFVDVNGDSQQDHLVPVCDVVENNCNASRILLQQGNVWHEVFVPEDSWNFISMKSSHLQQPITLVTGDYNLDTYIDILCVMQNGRISDSTLWQTVVLFGKPCSNEMCQSVGFQFELSLVISNSKGSFSSSFYDLSSDGNLDILVSTVGKDGLYSIQAFENTVSEDASFLFVKGGMLQTSATQLSQSAHLSLQLPYVCFGLGRLPNFVDQLVITVPNCLLPEAHCLLPYTGNNTRYQKSWTMIIPNSQMYVIPYPPNDPSKWSNELLVTPGHNVLDTLAVLVATCIAIAIAIVTLHCMERKQDRQEKIQEAHRFHFDAM